jgi:hypothetical protein
MVAHSESHQRWDAVGEILRAATDELLLSAEGVVAAPALINSWAAYGTASEVGKQQNHMNQLRQEGRGSQNAPLEPVQQPKGSLDFRFDSNLFPTVYAASESPLKTFSRANSSLAQQGSTT